MAMLAQMTRFSLWWLGPLRIVKANALPPPTDVVLDQAPHLAGAKPRAAVSECTEREGGLLALHGIGEGDVDHACLTERVRERLQDRGTIEIDGADRAHEVLIVTCQACHQLRDASRSK